MSYGANALANLLLDLGDDLHVSLTHMAIHKVLYYAHGWHLAEYRMPLVKQSFEAWEYGPVLKQVYASFKDAGKDPVTFRARRFDPVTETVIVYREAMADTDVNFIRNILRAYGSIDALSLSQMTHQKNGAWDRMWNAAGGKICLGMIISNDEIRRDFLGQGSVEA